MHTHHHRPVGPSVIKSFINPFKHTHTISTHIHAPTLTPLTQRRPNSQPARRPPAEGAMLALARHTVRTNSSRATAALLAASSSFSSSSSSYGVGGARQLSYEIKKVGVVGLGLMGHGIGLVSAQAGYEVVAVEAKPEALEAGKKRIGGSLKKMLSKSVEKGKLTAEAAAAESKAVEGRIKYSMNLEDLKDADLVIEAIVENLDVKIPFYKNLGSLVKPQAIFGSNTSSLKIADFARPSGRPEKFVGLHFFNPVQLMKLVEIVRIPETEQAVFEAAQAYVKKIGKVSVACKDTPGFIVNRLLVPALAQAMLLHERGDASVADIDVSMQLGAGHPMGPLTLADYVGLDTCLFILDGWVQAYPGEPAFVVPETLRKLVKAGKLGRKTGEGYWKWDGDRRTNTPAL